MNKRIKQLSLFVLVAIFTACNPSQEDIDTSNFSEYNFIVASDLGRNGYYDQKPIAELMGRLGEMIDVEFIAAAGDVHHFEGVASVNDPLWMTNYELVYSHPELMIDWYAILGNHEYRGNTQACIDYTQVSRRWSMPSRYYTMVKEVDDSVSIRLVFVDTAPLIGKYRNDTLTYPDAHKQNCQAQLQFVDSVLAASTEKWKVVIGHHPVYAYTSKDEVERTDMQATLKPLLEKHGVDYYFSGHIHNFQYIQMPDSPIDYIVNSSASLSRKVKETEGTLFCSDKSGFTVCSVEGNAFTVNFMDAKGKVIYSRSKVK